MSSRARIAEEEAGIKAREARKVRIAEEARLREERLAREAGQRLERKALWHQTHRVAERFMRLQMHERKFLLTCNLTVRLHEVYATCRAQNNFKGWAHFVGRQWNEFIAGCTPEEVAMLREFSDKVFEAGHGERVVHGALSFVKWHRPEGVHSTAPQLMRVPAGGGSSFEDMVDELVDELLEPTD